MLEIGFRADPRSAEPVYRQLAACLRGWIDTGRLPVGERLPPTRDLARALGLSRNTVLQAYLVLGDLGLVDSSVGRGTFVAAPPARAAAAPPPGRSRLRRVEGGIARVAEPRPLAWDGLLAVRARHLPSGAAGRELARSYAFDFRAGQVDHGSFPAAALARASARAIRAGGAALASNRDPLGWAPLRVALARRLVARGVVCTPDDILIVGGAQQALDLVGRTLVDPGDTVVVEQPGYFGAALALGAAGAHLVGVRVDEGGLRTDDAARLLRTRRAKLIYVTPAVQCPTGVTLAEPRREALLALADAHQVPILEDDYDSELRLGAPSPPALKARDTVGQVIYVATFSKALFPGLRVGYVVAPPPLLDRLAAAHLAADFQTSMLLQATVTELIESGVLERHVRRVRRLYAERCAAMRDALAHAFPEGTGIGAPAAGNALWVTLPPDVDAEAVAAAARAAGIAYERGDWFFLDAPPGPCLMLSFALVPAARIAEGIGKLGRIVHAHRGVRRTRRVR